MFPQLYKTFCIYSYHASFILSHKSDKRVTERNESLNFWSRSIKWGSKFLIRADWIIENALCQVLCLFLELFIKWRVCIVFRGLAQTW